MRLLGEGGPVAATRDNPRSQSSDRDDLADRGVFYETQSLVEQTNVTPVGSGSLQSWVWTWKWWVSFTCGFSNSYSACRVCSQVEVDVLVRLEHSGSFTLRVLRWNFPAPAKPVTP